MAKRVLLGIETTRTGLGARMKAADEEARTKEGADVEHTVITDHGKPTSVIVSIAWYRRASELLGEPTDL